MITREDRLDIVKDVLQRIAPDFFEKYAAPAHEEISPKDPFKINHQAPPETTNYSIGLRGLLRRLGPLPPFSALMGQCADGLPFLFDLSDPEPGSILIQGDEYSGKRQLLLTIMLSAAMLNNPDRVAINLITPNSGEFDRILHLPHTDKILSTYDRSSSELVIELAAVAEQRKSGRERGPMTLLAIDDLEKLLSYDEYELNSHLRWLLRYGPGLGIWPIATIDPRNLMKMDQRILAEFGTRLIGRSDQYQLADTRLNKNIPQLTTGNFTAVMGSEQINFCVPNL